jgi:3-dehydroquinate dehydratase-2
MTKILVINGPNLNRLGLREPEVYGHLTIQDLEAGIKQWCDQKGIEVSFLQSNHEGVLIDAIHEAEGVMDGIVINPGAFTHYSYGLRDALSSITVPAIEVHISNVYKREAFRQHSVVAPVCRGQIAGLGFKGYTLAIEALIGVS